MVQAFLCSDHFHIHNQFLPLNILRNEIFVISMQNNCIKTLANIGEIRQQASPVINFQMLLSHKCLI